MLRRVSVVCAIAMLPLTPMARAGEVQLEILHQTEGLADGAGVPVRISRLDYLLSNIALRAGDGTWEASRDWFGYVSHRQGRRHVSLGNIPNASFDRLRFQLGLDSQANGSDPNSHSAEHALNPQVNGLHWGWQGGYIFMALEGHYGSAGDRGYSYHLAGDGNAVTVEIPIKLDGQRHRSLTIAFDVAKALNGIHFAKDGASTHSREGDPLVPKLRSNLEGAFRFVTANADAYQKPKTAVNPVQTQSVGTPFPWRITKRFPRVTLPEDNVPTVQGVALGRALFHDPRLSKTNKVSCASCHHRESAFADTGKRFSTGVEDQLGKRNAMPLFNLLWEPSFFWDGRAATLREQVLLPIQDAHEMNETLDGVVRKLESSSDYQARFEQAFGTKEVSEEKLALALEQFLMTLVSQDSKFDRAARGEAKLTKQEQRGLQLFVTEHDPKRNLYGADCFHCHGGNLFTSHLFTNNGLDLKPADLGRFHVTGKDADRGHFKTPSLRNIALTAPYMHDGRFQSLEDVVEHYNSGVKRSPTLDPNLAKHPDAGLNLSKEDRQALVAFLHTLTDENFASTTPSLPSLTYQP